MNTPDIPSQSSTSKNRILTQSDYAVEILEMIDEVYYTLDTDWRFTYLNNKAEQLWNRKREDLIGKNIWVEFPEIVNTQSYVVMHEAIDDKKPVHYETLSSFLNLWVDVGIYPTPTGLIVNFRDITARKAAETELHAKQTQLQQITDSLPMLISEFDQQLHYRFVSKGYEDIFDLPRDQIVGRHMVEIVGPLAFEKAKHDVEAALRGELIQYEREIPYKIGTRVTRTQLIPHLAADGTQMGVIGIVDDITELRRLESNQAQLATIVTSSNDAIISKTMDGIITSWNPGAVRLFGYSPEEVINKPITIIFPPDRIEEETFLLKKIAAGDVVENFDTIRHRKDGSEVPVSVSLSPIKNKQGRIIGVSKIAYDISERKRVEKEMARKNRGLETLLYITSHDLREPLRAIRHFSDILQIRYHERLDVKGQDFLSRVIRAGDRMDRLIDDILQLSRVQRKMTPAEQVSGEILVADALKLLETRVEATGAVLTILSPLPLFFVDRFWAIQALFNLIANALKFTRPDAPPEIEIGAYNPPEGSLNELGLVVRDRGIGLETAHLERIFELFQRAVEREVEGTGAGLAIVREVAERHGGRAWAQPRSGGGSEFFITFGNKRAD